MERESEEYYGAMARFYDWRLADSNEEIPFYVQLAEEYGGPVLELGCGTGRITFPIAEAGIEVIGLDLSTDMLDIGKQKLSRMSAEVQTKTRLVQGNMADFALGRQFSLVILPNNQFRELLTTEDQLSCLRCINRHLRQDGSVVIEMSNPFRSIQRWHVGGVFHRKAGYCQETGTTVECIFKTKAVNLMEQWIEQETIYVEHLDDGSTVQHTGRNRGRFIFPGELDFLMEISGFDVADRWGGYDRCCLADDSPSIIVCAKAKTQTSGVVSL